MDPILVFLIQIAVILVATRAGAYAAAKLKLAPVIGELAAGIVLGPTVFGLLSPTWQARLFPEDETTNGAILQSFSWLGLILLMFVGGLDIETKTVRENLGRALAIAAGALALSFGASFLLSGYLPASLFPTPNPLAFRLFFANALAITSIPVLIKILIDLDLFDTRFGTTAVVAGVIVDAVGWIILAVLTRGMTASFSLLELLKTLGLIIAFIAVTFTFGRSLLARLAKLQVSEDSLSFNFLASVLALMLVGAAVTEYLNIHPVLGAFVVGLMVGTWRLSHGVKEKLAAFAFSFFIPIFLATLGLRANLLQINTWQLWGITLLIVVVLILSNYTGGGVAAKLTGMTWTESLAVGAAANTKGAMGLVAAKVAYDLGIIPSNLYAILVVVSITLTVIPVFGFQRLRRRLLTLDAQRTAATPVNNRLPL